MSELNENNFEDEWKKAFEDAESAPRPHVWVGVSQHLPKGKLNYWRNYKFLIYLSFLLLVSDTVLLWQKVTNSPSEINNSPLEISNSPSEINNSPSEISNSPSEINNSQSEISNTPSEINNSQSEISNSPTKTRNTYERLNLEGNNDSTTQVINEENLKFSDLALLGRNNDSIKLDTIKRNVADKLILEDFVSEVNPIISLENEPINHTQFKVARLQSLDMQSLKNLPAITILSDSNLSQAKSPKLKSGRFWLSVAGSAYILQSNQVADYQNYLDNYVIAHSATNVVVNDYFKGLKENDEFVPSYSIEVNLGYQINARWSIRSGIQYLQERVRHRSNAFFIDYQNGTKHLFAANLNSGNVANPSFVTAVHNHPSYQSSNINYLEMSDFNENDQVSWQSNDVFLSVPVQIGYTFNPTGKFKTTLFGGFGGDIFLNHRFASNEINNLNQNQKNYKTLTVTGLLNLQTEYALSPKLAVVLGLNYRRSLQSLNTSSYVKTLPEMWGLQIGWKYKF